MIGLARGDLDLESLERLSDAAVVEAITAQRGLGRWTADWFLARALGRPDAWPAGDLAVRKAVSFFYGSGRDLDETEVREVGERFGPGETSPARCCSPERGCRHDGSQCDAR